MSKPRILIGIHYLEIGGAESALIGLLSNLDPRKVDIDLFVYDHRGEMMEYIPKNVNVLPALDGYKYLERPIIELVRNHKIKLAFARLIAKMEHYKYRRYNKVEISKASDSSIHDFVAKRVIKYLPEVNPNMEYDLAISFLAPHNYIREKVKAKKYAAWIHTDYSKVFVSKDRELHVWDKYDKIVSISEGVTNEFLKIFPSLKEKITLIPNFLPENLINNKSKKFYPTEFENYNGAKILSVGRFCEAKNYDNIPYVAKILKDKGLDFKWFIIGYGDKTQICDAIEKTGTEEDVIILGKRSNPYPYIRYCDIYAQPSRYEGHSVTVEEAKLFYRPILVTNYATAKSQIKDGETGVICEINNNSIANCLYSLITNGKLRNMLTDNLKQLSSKDKGVELFYKLLND